MTYPITGPPDDLADLPVVYPAPGWLDSVKNQGPRCKAETPSWGWECDPEQCQRRPHDDGWHYVGEDELRIWWTEAK